ncbi:hypothetical protein J2T56_002824 [Natronobacillus azotifigens]|uniref:Uncharacterized protein n=1 Tax=Natronobacillus azotifigens TaxID=472978 RepID=A0A9J6RH13_9BACI|nr:hypothetical protein [Natronobacillus azotifigens]MCZ0704425.1 hypothetical protein [Natronobacillus azotifigens]
MKLKSIIITLHLFIGIGAVFGGFGALVNPEAPLGMPADTLINGPFENFFIPGLFLFCILGGGNVIAAIMTIRDKSLCAYGSILLGLILCVWIVIQCYILYTVIFLHVLFFVLGLIQLVLGALFVK